MANVSLESCMERMSNICYDRGRAAADIALVQVSIYGQKDRLEAYTAIGENIIAHIPNQAVRIQPERIGVPSLFICGRDDIRIPIGVIDANHHRIRGLKIAVFDRCGHLPEIEHPALLKRSPTSSPTRKKRFRYGTKDPERRVARQAAWPVFAHHSRQGVGISLHRWHARAGRNIRRAVRRRVLADRRSAQIGRRRLGAMW
jgi:hypothetical protein